MTNPIAKNLPVTRPMLWSFSLALGSIYILSGLNLFMNDTEQIILQQPQQAVMLHVFGHILLGIFSILLGLLHFYGILGKNYRATILAYEIGMGYLSAWAVSYLFIIESRPNLAIQGFIGIGVFIGLTLSAIKERTQVHNL